MSNAGIRRLVWLAIGPAGPAIAVAADLCHVGFCVHQSRSGAALLAGFCADIVELFALVHAGFCADVAVVGLAVCFWEVIKVACFGGAFVGV